MKGHNLRVLSVCTSLEGGAGRAAWRIHQGVQKLGIDSRIFVKIKHDGDASVIPLDRFVPKNALYSVFDWIRNKCKNKIQHMRWGLFPDRESVYMSDLRGVELQGALHKLDYDVLHLHWINQRFVPLSRLPRDKPIVWTLHDSWPFCGVCHYFFECDRYRQECGFCPLLHSDKADDLSRKVWRKKSNIYKNLDLHIVCPSRWLADSAMQSSLLKSFPVVVIPNCLDINSFRPLSEENYSPRWREFHDKSSRKPYVLYGAINAATDKRKGFSFLLSSLQMLDNLGHKDDFELIVFGTEALEWKLDISIPIHYVGYVNDTKELVSLYNLASVMVVPSLAEVFGQTASESLACGTPVVAFRSTGLQEIVEHKINGYLAEPYSVEDLANGILWCLQNNTDSHLGLAAREKVLREYSSDVVALKYKALYESVL